MKGSAYVILGIIIFGQNSVLAGGFESLIFSQEGRLVHPQEGEALPEDLRVIDSRVLKTCPESQGKKCVEWDLAVPAEFTGVAQIIERIQNVFSVFSNQLGFDIYFQHRSVIHDVGIPYQYVGNAIELDEFENPIVTGNFRISYLPSAEIEFDEGEAAVASRSYKYIVPDLEANRGDIRWGGIFINPSLVEGSDYSLERVMMNEAGHLIGLSPSAVRSAKMFPVLPQAQLTTVQLHTDELAWVRAAYPAANAFDGRGTVSGEVIDGDTGDKHVGAHIELIPMSKKNIFAQQGLATLGETGAFSRADGKFEIQGVPAGDYLVIIERLSAIHPDPSVWDDAIFALGSTKEFVTEFYDGAERESNHESAYGFSPQLILLAATIKVVAGETTSGIQIITNTLDQNAAVINAQGSSNESLAEISDDVDERLAALKGAEPPAIPKASGAFKMSCELSGDTAFDYKDYGLSFALVLWGALVFVLRKRPDNKESAD